VSVIADAYLAGVSTWRVEKLVQQLGVERMPKSQVSRLAKSLDRIGEEFRTSPLDGAPYPYQVLDALEVKCRDGGRTVKACVVHAVAVNRDGFRESLGPDVVTSEDGSAWLAFLRSLVALAASAAPGSSPRTPTPASSTRSRPRCPAPPGSAVAPTSCAIS
jgi:putative transposase